jgi:hypothetical protein
MQHARRHCRRQSIDIRALDRATLLLCISLLDHLLCRSVFESLVIVFLAVLGINKKNDGAFCNAAVYSPVLSKFIKIL